MSVKVIDKGWERIQRELKRMSGAYVKVGYPEEKEKQHDSSSGPVNMAKLAAWHEYGVPQKNIPPRPVQAMTFAANIDTVRAIIAQNQEAIYQGKTTVSLALRRLGAFYKGQMQRMFILGTFQALKAATIAARKRRFGRASSRPLVATAQLRQSVDFEYVEGKKGKK